jgi:hypothetical protein
VAKKTPVSDQADQPTGTESIKPPKAYNDRWFSKKGDDLAGEVWSIATNLTDNQKWRTRAAKDLIELYDGRALRGDMTYGGISLEDYTTPYESELTWNVTKSACDSVVSEISGRQKPMGKFLTSGGDWKTKRRARKMEKFVLAVMNQRQGPYLQAWEMMEDVFRDSTVVEFGIAKVFWSEGRVQMERHYSWEFYVDPSDAKYGCPKSLFHVRTMERDLALWEFALNPDLDISDYERAKITSAINGAPEVDPGRQVYGAERVAKCIRVVEGWHLKIGKMSGKHCFVINGCTLHEEPWERDHFPFLRLRWDPDIIGWGGHSLAASGQQIHREINENTTKLQERFRICGAKRTFYTAGSVDETAMQSNETETFIEVQAGAPFPQESVPKPIGEAEKMWLDANFQRYYEMQGVSQLKASSRKEPGVESGVAIRTLNDMSSSRFATKAKRYENSFVELAYLIIDTAREAYQAGEIVEVPGMEEYDFGDFDLPSTILNITVTPASSLPNDLAGRLQTVQELGQSGLISPPVYKELLNWPDLEKEMDYQTAQRRYIEKTIDMMLDQSESSQDPRVAPDPFLPDKPGALVQCAQAYFDALYNDAPEYNLQLLRDYMKALDQLIAVTMMGQMPAGGPPAAMAGAPPGGAPAGPAPMPS